MQLRIITISDQPCCKGAVGGAAPDQLCAAPAAKPVIGTVAPAQDCGACRVLWDLGVLWSLGVLGRLGVTARWVGGREDGQWCSAEGQDWRGVVRQLLCCVPPTNKYMRGGM